jgi:hypothetical protein
MDETICTSKDLWSFGWLRIFLRILSNGYAFWHSFSRFGWFSLSTLFCQMSGTGGSFAIEDATVKSLSFECISAFEFVTGSSCWGGTIVLASNIQGSSTSRIALVQVTAAIWNISRSMSLCSIKSSPSLSSSRSTVDKSSSCALLFRFSNNHDSASALQFCDPGM